MDSLLEDKKLHLKSFATASNNNKPTEGQTRILFVISNKLHTDLKNQQRFSTEQQQYKEAWIFSSNGLEPHNGKGYIEGIK